MRTSKLLALLAAILLFAGHQLANAESVNIGGINYELDNDNLTASVASNSEAKGDIILPQTLNHNGKIYALTAIDDEAFMDCEDIISITLPEGLTSIGRSAFNYCEGLRTITIPASVAHIGDEAFCGCTEMRSMVVDSGNKVYDSREGCNAIIVTATGQLLFGCNTSTIPAGVTSIADEAFYKCYDLTSAILPEGVTTIGEYAFYKCEGLRSVSLPKSLASIGECAFCDCFRMGSIDLPEGLTDIGEKAFFCMDALQSVRIPASVTSIGTDAFGECINLNSIVVEEGNTVYDSRENCNAIIETATNTLTVGCQATNIPATVTAIGMQAFACANGINAVTLPESLTSVGFLAFSQCEQLTTVTFMANNATIDAFAFSGCTSLKDIYCYGKEMYQAKPNAFDGIPTNVTLHVHAPLVEAYRQSQEWTAHFASIVPLPGEDVDGISQVNSDTTTRSFFTIDGRKLSAPQKGLNIMKRQDGHCVKMMR